MHAISWCVMIYEPKAGIYSPAVTGYLLLGIQEINNKLKNEQLEWEEVFKTLEIIPCPREIKHEIFPYKEVTLGRPDYMRGGRKFYKLKYR